jgi:hypothetical protein
MMALLTTLLDVIYYNDPHTGLRSQGAWPRPAAEFLALINYSPRENKMVYVCCHVFIVSKPSP